MDLSGSFVANCVLPVRNGRRPRGSTVVADALAFIQRKIDVRLESMQQKRFLIDSNGQMREDRAVEWLAAIRDALGEEQRRLQVLHGALLGPIAEIQERILAIRPHHIPADEYREMVSGFVCRAAVSVGEQLQDFDNQVFLEKSRQLPVNPTPFKRAEESVRAKLKLAERTWRRDWEATRLNGQSGATVSRLECEMWHERLVELQRCHDVSETWTQLPWAQSGKHTQDWCYAMP